MKHFFWILIIASITVQAQDPDALEAHRLQYKTDLANEIKADTSMVRFYPFNRKLLLTAKVEVLENQRVFKFITSSGKTKEARKYVRVTFSINGKSHTLFGYQILKLKESKETADHFFIPFRDATSGKTTYEGGRYLDFKTGDIDKGSLILDFNKAYNPYCAFVDGYNCPIPPRENTLNIPIAAGEKKYPKPEKS